MASLPAEPEVCAPQPLFGQKCPHNPKNMLLQWPPNVRRMLWLCCQGPKATSAALILLRDPAVQRMLWLCWHSSKNHVCYVHFSPRLPACNGCFGCSGRAPKTTSATLIFLRDSQQCNGCFGFAARASKSTSAALMFPHVQRMLWPCWQSCKNHAFIACRCGRKSKHGSYHWGPKAAAEVFQGLW